MSIENVDHERWMLEALSQASRAEAEGEVPVGAVLVYKNQIIATGWNHPISAQDPTAHAEIIALREGAQVLGNYRLLNTTLYVTLEPCAMCAGAMIHARIENLFFGAYDLRTGAVQSVFQLLDDKRLNHRVTWEGGVLEDACGLVLKSFFKKKR